MRNSLECRLLNAFQNYSKQKSFYCLFTFLQLLFLERMESHFDSEVYLFLNSIYTTVAAQKSFHSLREGFGNLITELAHYHFLAFSCSSILKDLDCSSTQCLVNKQMEHVATTTNTWYIKS